MIFELLEQTLKGFFWGFFIGGVIITIIMMALAGFSISHGGGDTGTGADTGADVSTDTGGDVSADTGADITTDTGGDITTDTGSDITTDTGADAAPSIDGHDTGSSDTSNDFSSHDTGHDGAGHGMTHDSGYIYQAHGAGETGHVLDSHPAVNLNAHSGGMSAETPLIASDKGQKAPFLLLFAGFFMFAGAFGLMFFGLEEVSIFLVLGIAFLPPLLFVKLLGLVWRKITRSETYIIPAEMPLIGLKVRVLMPVDADGGEVRIDASGSPIGSQRLAVMPLYPQKTFGQGEEIFICDYASVKGVRFYLVDDDPSEIRRKTHVQV